MSFDPHIDELLAVTTVSSSGQTTLTHLSNSGQNISAASGAVTLILPVASSSPRKIFFIKKTDSSGNVVTVTRGGSDLIDGATTYALSTQYNWLMVESDATSNWEILSKTPSSSGGISYTLSSKSAGFTANGTTGTFYQITCSSAVAITLPASPADATIYKFIVVSGTALATFTANGAETILNGYQSSATMTLAYLAGAVELIAVSGGWQVT